MKVLRTETAYLNLKVLFAFSKKKLAYQKESPWAGNSGEYTEAVGTEGFPS